MERKIFNPIFGDEITVIKDSSETNGVYSLFSVKIGPYNPGPPLHQHHLFEEYFSVESGVVHIVKDKERQVLKEGDEACIKKGSFHKFWTEDAPATFTCKVVPACDGQIEALKIAANLAKAGKTTKRGIPKNPWHSAVILYLSASSLPGRYKLFEKIFTWMATSKKGQRTQAYLLQHYGEWSA